MAVAMLLVAVTIGACGGGSGAGDVCDAAAHDAAAIVAWGTDYRSGKLSVTDLRDKLDGAATRWQTTASGTTDNLMRLLASRMHQQLQVTQFAAVHNVPGGDDYSSSDGPGLVVQPGEWTGGDLGYDYRQACGRDLPK